MRGGLAGIRPSGDDGRLAGRRDGGGDAVRAGRLWGMDGWGRAGRGGAGETEGGEGGKRLCSVFAVEVEGVAGFVEHVESCQCRVLRSEGGSLGSSLPGYSR